MSFSVCLIAKNEEENLERVLSSFESVADEIILTDTGSTDGTVELAKKLGAKVSHFAWCDDFSAARHFCFKQTKGDWIFWIDADEELVADSVEEVRRCLIRQAKLNEAVEILEGLLASEKHGEAARGNLMAIKEIQRGQSGRVRRRRK